MPTFLGEVAAFAQILTHEGILSAIEEKVRFARARFGQYDVIDFVAVLIGYVVSGEPTLLAFYERLVPWAEPFMALFGRHHLPHRSTLSRFLAALDQPTVEALRMLFHKDLLARKASPSLGGLVDRIGKQWVVIDVDGTKQAARQRALPQIDSLPAPIAVLGRCVRQATWGANGEKWCAPEQWYSRHIRISFSARSVDLAMEITAANCDGLSRLSPAMRHPLGFPPPLSL